MDNENPYAFSDIEEINTLLSEYASAPQKIFDAEIACYAAERKRKQAEAGTFLNSPLKTVKDREMSAELSVLESGLVKAEHETLAEYNRQKNTYNTVGKKLDFLKERIRNKL